jgi:hypothetical protein
MHQQQRLIEETLDEPATRPAVSRATIRRDIPALAARSMAKAVRLRHIDG